MTAASTRSTLAGRVPVELVCELGEAVALHLYDYDGPVGEAPAVAPLIARIGRATDVGPDVDAFIRRIDADLPDDARRDFAVAVHPVQVRSKLWLIDELARHCDLAATPMLVLGGWYGILPLLLNWRLACPPPRMVTIDIDAAAVAVGRQIVGAAYENVEFRIADAMELDYGAEDVVVNTICEHLPDLAGWWERIPLGRLVAVQSNNYTGCPDHVSAVKSLDAFKAQLPMSEPLFEGVLPLPPYFDRYMLIGRR